MTAPQEARAGPPALDIRNAALSLPRAGLPDAEPQRRRCPANGRKLLNLRHEGFSPSLAVLIVDGWGPAAGQEDYLPWVAVIPDGTPIGLIDFRCIAGLTVYMVTDWLRRLDEIALQVLKYQPKAAFGWADKSKNFAVYARDLS